MKLLSKTRLQALVQSRVIPLLPFPEKSLGIALCDDVVTGALFTNNGSIKLEKTFSEPLEGRLFSSALSSLVKKEGLAGMGVNLSIGEPHTFSKSLEVPSEANIDEWLVRNSSAYLPVGVKSEDIYFDYLAAPSENGITHVFLAGARLSEIESLHHAARESGLLLDKIGFSGLDVLNLVERKDPVQAFIHVNKKTSTVIVTERVCIRFCKNIPAGLDILHETPRYFYNELDKLLVFYAEIKAFMQPIQKVIPLNFDRALLSGYSDRAGMVVGEPCFCYAIPDKIHLLAAGLGVKTLLPTAVSIDLNNEFPALLARQKREARFFRQTAAIAGAAFSLFAVLALLLWAAVAGFTVINNKREQRINPDYIALHALKTENQRLISEIRHAGTLAEKRSNKARLLQLIAQQIPSSAWLVGVTGREKAPQGWQTTITGFAYGQAVVTNCIGNLEKTGEFKSVKLTYTEHVKDKARQPQPELIRFEIALE
ncbi:MAG: hypothetical protein A2268_11805 [Candidatus Raymondbacteria bacterium RifOxyA12_full_50_37]|uniref:Uncharacterized protein n=1 Tax=Candidatus Raymondbacteria bacterium RIFOXYD12_FULL_49_13 TaxID=1817890 RepID=A0A1F7FL42_UNCRA|nr:MAG: hypothetical protein A2268_11805 [Candidatus Raymondbacteria bacterium RifOxyA12_full_50_37]OGJ98726.1 MAG: hypothetical protein A2453_08240 [Candidatus Raymondbacteria bacterium RIFOXYC2_FULL_50_21]OGJ99176.1 MAG: hypothetical protein A2350_17960 [Candidatus Raymondbacteria bacterium RifOxyB12_full_50_8]OGK07444.1 MAG: hypothetical protein A2519_11135 [Candidatus Raymondbacteria bacterium RIFOXYD12_FULL_49_13]OGK07811.1 MAG: hypothetical protein A2487_00160 [Candidatus Raymondbacteria 